MPNKRARQTQRKDKKGTKHSWGFGDRISTRFPHSPQQEPSVVWAFFIFNSRLTAVNWQHKKAVMWQIILLTWCFESSSASAVFLGPYFSPRKWSLRSSLVPGTSSTGVPNLVVPVGTFGILTLRGGCSSKMLPWKHSQSQIIATAEVTQSRSLCCAKATF